MINQRALLAPGELAKEYRLSDNISRIQAERHAKSGTAEYNTHVSERFANWRLKIDGLVANPMYLSVAELRRLPAEHKSQSMTVSKVGRRSGCGQAFSLVSC